MAFDSSANNLPWTHMALLAGGYLMGREGEREIEGRRQRAKREERQREKERERVSESKIAMVWGYASSLKGEKRPYKEM